MKVMTVCSGNICRSPMAAAILKHLRPNITVFSRGVNAGDGCPITFEAAIALKDVGIPVPNHRSAQLQPGDVRRADVILCATRAHRDVILADYPYAANKTFTIKPDGDVEDPYPLTADVYSTCRDELTVALKKWLPKLSEEDKRT